jgi:tetratricopeptide (TPR) repeat protein
MPTKDMRKAKAAAETPGRLGGRIDTEAFQAAITIYTTGLEALSRHEWSAARERFLEVSSGYAEERELAERARMYSRICDQRLAPQEVEPTTGVAAYRRAVFLSNHGRHDEALKLFDRALAETPLSADYLYARAATWALKGVADRAVADLRQAILVDRTVRFQAANDPDFQRVREEPAFIDIIEPTPTGA